MADADFQRARSPAQREERRVLLLETAERLLRERGDVSAFSLNELAREAGMAKSNVYRYFESREALLFEVLEGQWQAWFLRFDESVRSGAPFELEQFCQTLCRSLGESPLLCSLMSSLPSVLERNASVETIFGFKLRSVESLARVGHYCHQICPELSPEEFEKLLHLMIVAMTGLWPYSNPSAMVQQALADPRLSYFRHHFSADLSEMVTFLARGLIASRSS